MTCDERSGVIGFGARVVRRRFRVGTRDVWRVEARIAGMGRRWVRVDCKDAENDDMSHPTDDER